MEKRSVQQKQRSWRAENLIAMRLPLAPTVGMSAERLKKQKKSKAKKKKMKKKTAGMGTKTVTMKMSGKQRGDSKNDNNDTQ
jgi:hypothetical protein